MPGLNRLTIQSKMILLLLAVSLGSIAVMAWLGYVSAREALMQSARDRLQGVRVAKTTTLKTMRESLRDQVVSNSESKAVIEGMRTFRAAHRELGTAVLGPEENAQLDAFYRDFFVPELDKNVEGTPAIEQYLPGRPSERYLQYHYTAANPHAYGEKQNLNEPPGDRSTYGQAHAELHKFAWAVRIFGFQDMMRIDADTLDIIYSYKKASELGTNLESGPDANTGLGAKVREMCAQKDRDDFKIADFEAYRPNLGLPMGFALGPIFDGPQMTGILALQFPIDNFNTVLAGSFNWEAEGLGHSGEVYLVGPDGATGCPVQIAESGLGECFGDRLTAGGGAKKVSIVADGDLKVVVFSDKVMDGLLKQTPSLAAEIGEAVEVRCQAAHAVRRRV